MRTNGCGAGFHGSSLQPIRSMQERWDVRGVAGEDRPCRDPIAVDRHVTTTADRHRIAHRARAEDVVADEAAVRANTLAVTPGPRADADAELEQRRTVDEDAVADDARVGIVRVVWPAVDRIDAAETFAGAGDDRVGDDDGARTAEDDDRAVGRIDDGAETSAGSANSCRTCSRRSRPDTRATARQPMLATARTVRRGCW